MESFATCSQQWLVSGFGASALADLWPLSLSALWPLSLNGPPVFLALFV